VIRRGVRGEQGTTLRETVGIDGGSVVREFGSFVSHIVRGDLGTSSRTNEDVADVIGRAAPVTLSLVLGGVVFWLLLAIPIGVVSALRPRSLLDRAGMIFVLIGVSAHPLWIALTARAIGMSERRILRTQVLRNASLPIVTMLGMDIGLAFAGAIFVERAFGLPGIGRLLVSSLGRQRSPVVLGIVVLVTIVILLVNLVVDLLDPRIRYTSGSHSSNARSKWPRGRAPTTVALGSPSANKITVGRDRTP
jgi:peptide/nickel transport system permease protein